MESGGVKSVEELECESEDGIEGDVVFLDYESVEDLEGEEGEYSEEENFKVELKLEVNDVVNFLIKEEKGEEKFDIKSIVIGER